MLIRANADANLSHVANVAKNQQLWSSRVWLQFLYSPPDVAVKIPDCKILNFTYALSRVRVSSPHTKDCDNKSKITG